MKRILSLAFAAFLLVGCTTTKSTDGTVTKKLDPEAVAAVQAAVHQAIIDSIVLQEALQKK